MIAVPWTILGLALIGFNLFCNIGLNEGWAGGNLWLIGNTVYLILQFALSIGLFWEIDVWIYWMKFIRIFSLLSSYIYIFGYLFALVTDLIILDDLDGSEIRWANVYSAMVLSYNLILHAPILPICIGISIKEFSMEVI